VVAKAKAALTAEESAVVQAAFGNVQYKWARERQPDGKFIDKSFDGMLKDIEKAEGTAAMKNFIYEVSDHMHSATLTRLSTGCDSSRRLWFQLPGIPGRALSPVKSSASGAIVTVATWSKSAPNDVSPENDGSSN
jgi:hypothetical protein